MGSFHDEWTKSLLLANATISDLAGVKADSLGRRDELAAGINFEDIVPTLDSILQIFRDLDGRSIDRMSQQQLDVIKNKGQDVTNLIKKIRDFSIEAGDAKANCDAIKESAYRVQNDVIHHLAAHLAFTATQAADYASLEREAEGLVSRVRRDTERFEIELGKSQAEIESALNAIKQQAAEAGISQNAKYFADEAVAHGADARKWRIATIWTSVAAGVVAAGFLALSLLYTPDSAAAAIQLVASKIIVLSVLSFAIVWTARNYRSHRHNEIVNRHRAHALSTFKTFAEGSDDQAVKEAILLAAADSAFSARSSGFDGNEGDSNHSQIQHAESVLRLALRASSRDASPQS
jgi:hypothetical protein